jgi:uncharacterized protein YegL
MAIGEPEFVNNPEPRCPVVLIVDTSASMSGIPIEQLNNGLKLFKKEVSEDSQAALRVEVAIITFGGTPKLHTDFTPIVDFNPPKLETSGETPMGAALELALEKIRERKETYKRNGIYYYRPWLWLITDGAPTDGNRWQDAATRIHAGEMEKGFSFFVIAVEGAQIEVLKQIAVPFRPVVNLNGLQFREMFLWLSKSMKKASTAKPGAQVPLPPIDGWGAIQN